MTRLAKLRFTIKRSGTYRSKRNFGARVCRSPGRGAENRRTWGHAVLDTLRKGFQLSAITKYYLLHTLRILNATEPCCVALVLSQGTLVLRHSSAVMRVLAYAYVIHCHSNPHCTVRLAPYYRTVYAIVMQCAE